MSRKNYKWDVLLFTSRYEDYSYEDYCAFCDANDVAPCKEGSDDFYSWLADEIEMNWDDFQCELSHFAPYDAEVVVEGTLGLWYGKRTIEPTEFDCVLKAVQKCINSADDVVIRYEKGIITVDAYHHDGHNSFTIRPRDKRRKLPYLFG